MGNIHGHRKHRNNSHQNKPSSNSQPFKYGPSDQAPPSTSPKRTWSPCLTVMWTRPYEPSPAKPRGLASAPSVGSTMMGQDHFVKDVAIKNRYGLCLKFQAPFISRLT
ncbi:hypothetical protein CFP56_041743 [Quercus suber]|uniref:Uncharacterized protein n=1 Tax=Quercus suber TaxID=58331 RepID=A0AAW0LMD3_QUESU